MRVVFSIDLMRTFVFGVIGELASLRGLKLNTVFRIRLAVLGRVRMSTERVFSVASTSRASLLRAPWSVSAQDGAGLLDTPAIVL